MIDAIWEGTTKTREGIHRPAGKEEKEYTSKAIWAVLALK